MNQFDGELAALQNQRRMEQLHGPAGVENALDAFASWASQAGLSGMGLFRRALKSGQTPVETLVSQLESAASEEIRRIWEHLKGQEEKLKEFAERLKSQEAQAAFFAAIFHGLRTSDPQKQARLAILTINSVHADAMGSESLDDLMRASVELTDWDIDVLGKMYASQKHLISRHSASHDWSEQVGHLWTEWNRTFGLGENQHLKLRSALSRLQSHGLIAEAQTNFVKDGTLARQAFGLLPEGKVFYERLEWTS